MTRPQRLAITFGAARIAYAAALAGDPRRTSRPWLGGAAETAGGRVAVRGLAARDAVLSVGVAVAALRGSPVRPWLAACVASDAADIAATLGDAKGLPDRAVPATVALAGAAAFAGAALAASWRYSASAESGSAWLV